MEKLDLGRIKDAAFKAQIKRGEMIIAKTKLSTVIYNLERKKKHEL